MLTIAFVSLFLIAIIASPTAEVLIDSSDYYKPQPFSIFNRVFAIGRKLFMFALLLIVFYFYRMLTSS